MNLSNSKVELGGPALCISLGPRNTGIRPCLPITAKEDPGSGWILRLLILPMMLALALWLWSWRPGLAVALTWICLGPTNPNMRKQAGQGWMFLYKIKRYCPGGGGTVPKGGPAWGLEVLVEVSQSSCFKFQIAKV